MQARNLVTAVLATGILVALGCGGTQAPPGTTAVEECLPAEFPGLELVREGEIMHFEGDSLFNYINGAAEMYHKYGFAEVHVGRYRRDGGAITVDIYRFARPDFAFGMYSTIRPDDPDVVLLGAQGFTFGPVIIFAKPPYLVNVQTYDESIFTPSDVQAVAAAVDRKLAGTDKLPDTFALFPAAGRIPHSERIFAESFLGRGFLTDVYTVDYSLGASDATFFLARDEGGAKFGRWAEAPGTEGAGSEEPPGMAYDDGSAALFQDRYYGQIIAGLTRGWLAGIVRYEPAQEQVLREWLGTLPATAR
jgi:hypothetical protein